MAVPHRCSLLLGAVLAPDTSQVKTAPSTPDGCPTWITSGTDASTGKTVLSHRFAVQQTLKKKLVAIGLTLLMAVLINVAFALFVFGESIGEWVASRFGMGSAFQTVWNLARWPLAIFLFMFLLAVLYYLAPNIEQSFQWISPGSVVATALWIGADLPSACISTTRHQGVRTAPSAA